MREWDARRIAELAGARLLREPSADPSSEPSTGRPSDPSSGLPVDAPSGGRAPARGPRRAVIDSRSVSAGELFVGLRGERSDGGAFAAQALKAGAWGVLVAPEHAYAAAEAGEPADGGAVLSHEDPLAGLQALAREWRRELAGRGAKVVAVTGSTGKTSTKDILEALLGSAMRVAASPANFNTEIGLPLAVLGAPGDVEALVLEMAMRGPGQIAELTAIAEPDVGVIVNVGPAHLELLGSIEAIAAAKAELIAGLAPGTSIVVPAAEPLLSPHLRKDVHTISFGEGGDVRLAERRADGSVTILADGERIELRPSFSQAHNLRNLLAAVAVARALGYTPRGDLDVCFSAMRGQREILAGGVVVIDDCYNANPMSMHAAIDDLAETAPARRVAVLGDMLELGPDSPRLHSEIGEHASARGVELLIAVGPLAAEMTAGFAGECRSAPNAAVAAEFVGGLLRDGDTVLVKGSRGVGLERVVASLRGARERPRGEQRPAGDDHVLASGAGSGQR